MPAPSQAAPVSLLLATAPQPASASSSARSIVVRRARGRVVVTVHGELDQRGVAILEGVLSDLIEGQGNLNVALDLRDAHFGEQPAPVDLRVPAEQARRRGAAFVVVSGGRRGPASP